MSTEFKVANCFKHFLLCLMLKINLTHYDIIKSSVDGDRSHMFWIKNLYAQNTINNLSLTKKS